MVEENDVQADNKITLEIARELAVKGNYNEAIDLLNPLINSEFSIEALNLLGKIYAQTQNFDSAEKCFSNALKIDKDNSEALAGLNKCKELKNSKLKTYFSFNKLKVYSIAVVLLLLIGAIALISFNSFNSDSGTVSTEAVFTQGVVSADSDAITICFKTYGDSQMVISSLDYLASTGYDVDVVEGNGYINVTSDRSSVYEVLYVLDASSVSVNSVTFSLTNATAKTAIDNASNVAIENYESNSSIGLKQTHNVSSSIVPNTISFEEADGYSIQQQNIFYMLGHDIYTKIPVISVVEIS